MVNPKLVFIKTRYNYVKMGKLTVKESINTSYTLMETPFLFEDVSTL